jgi:hypothetical protein
MAWSYKLDNIFHITDLFQSRIKGGRECGVEQTGSWSWAHDMTCILSMTIGFRSSLVSSAFRLFVGGLLHLLSCDQRSAIYCSSWRAPMTFGLLSSLSNSKLYLLLNKPSTIFGSYIGNRFSSLFVSTLVSLPRHLRYYGIYWHSYWHYPSDPVIAFWG